jgi:hypothetical protein
MIRNTGISPGSISSRLALLLLLVSFGASLIAPPVAVSAPATLLSVGQTSRHLTATWSLPPGAQSRVIEAATSPAAGSDGYFFTENVSLFDLPESIATTHTSTHQMSPGFYYVHVATQQEGCMECPIREWSNVLTLVVPPDPDLREPDLLTSEPSTQPMSKLFIARL